MKSLKQRENNYLVNEINVESVKNLKWYKNMLKITTTMGLVVNVTVFDWYRKRVKAPVPLKTHSNQKAVGASEQTSSSGIIRDSSDKMLGGQRHPQTYRIHEY